MTKKKECKEVRCKKNSETLALALALVHRVLVGKSEIWEKGKSSDVGSASSARWTPGTNRGRSGDLQHTAPTRPTRLAVHRFCQPLNAAQAASCRKRNRYNGGWEERNSVVRLRVRPTALTGSGRSREEVGRSGSRGEASRGDIQ